MTKINSISGRIVTDTHNTINKEIIDDLLKEKYNYIFSPEEVRIFLEQFEFNGNYFNSLCDLSPPTHQHLKELRVKYGFTLDEDGMIQTTYCYMTCTEPDEHLCKAIGCDGKTMFMGVKVGFKNFCSRKCSKGYQDNLRLTIKYFKSETCTHVMTPEELIVFFKTHDIGKTTLDYLRVVEHLTFDFIEREYKLPFEQGAYLYMSGKTSDDIICKQCGNKHTEFRNNELGFGEFCSSNCAREYRKVNGRVRPCSDYKEPKRTTDYEIITPGELKSYLEEIDFYTYYKYVLKKYHPKTHKHISNLYEHDFIMNTYLYYTNTTTDDHLCKYCKTNLPTFDGLQLGFKTYCSDQCHRSYDHHFGVHGTKLANQSEVAPTCTNPGCMNPVIKQPDGLWGKFCSKKCCYQTIVLKTKKSMMEKYGVENGFQSPIIREKIKNTMIERHGVASPAQNPNVHSKMQKSGFKLKPYNFDGNDISLQGYEPIVLDYLRLQYKFDDFCFKKTSLNYIFDNKERVYFPDFMMLGGYVEVKSGGTFEYPRDKNMAKINSVAQTHDMFLFIAHSNRDQNKIEKIFGTVRNSTILKFAEKLTNIGFEELVSLDGYTDYHDFIHQERKIIIDIIDPRIHNDILCKDTKFTSDTKGYTVIKCSLTDIEVNQEALLLLIQ